MSYTLQDFKESLIRVDIWIPDIKSVIAAWGEQGDLSEWNGGFLLEMKDTTYRYLYGWCDTTGWGCQDDANIKFYYYKPTLGGLKELSDKEYKSYCSNKPSEWDIAPADLNKWINDGYPSIYEDN